MRFEEGGIMNTNNNNNDDYVFLNVFMFWIVSILLTNINPQKEIFHNYDFSVYTASKYWDLTLDTYRRITQIQCDGEKLCNNFIILMLHLVH